MRNPKLKIDENNSYHHIMDFLNHEGSHCMIQNFLKHDISKEGILHLQYFFVFKQYPHILQSIFHNSHNRTGLHQSIQSLFQNRKEATHSATHCAMSSALIHKQCPFYHKQYLFIHKQMLVKCCSP